MREQSQDVVWVEASFSLVLLGAQEHREVRFTLRHGGWSFVCLCQSVIDRWLKARGLGLVAALWGCVKSHCVQLCDTMDCSPPGSSVHGFLRARILKWVAVPSSRWASQPRD